MQVSGIFLALDLVEVLLRDRDDRTEKFLAVEPDPLLGFGFHPLKCKAKQAGRLRFHVHRKHDGVGSEIAYNSQTGARFLSSHDSGGP